MQRWIVLYTLIPTNYNPQRKLVVEAADAATARKIARRHIGDEGLQFANYHIEAVNPHVPEPLTGRVVDDSITRCPVCDAPTHATESDDSGRCEPCRVQHQTR